MDLETLQALTELKYQKSLGGLADILTKETQLRGQIDKLRQQAFETQALPADQPHMHSIGADVIWLKWVGRTISRLNVELAQVLAQKEALLAGQRRALGRKTVAEALARNAKDAHRQTCLAKSLEQAIETSVRLAPKRR
ncbi:MAG: hypothetical protein AAFN94_06515 [Pseudomonadota bacterium]